MKQGSRKRHIFWVITRRWWRAAFAARLGLTPATRRREIFAHQLREAFEELGPAFIKLGQLISIRPDMFPPQYVFEMEHLRDEVAPTPFEAVRPVIERDFGRPLDELFSDFDTTPIGSASIAQVYQATLRTDYTPVIGEVLPAGTKLAVKVIRPGSEETIRADIAVITPLINRISRFKRLARFNLSQLLSEFADSLASECDLRREGRTSDRFAFDFADDPYVTTAAIIWPLTTRHVLTMQFVKGWHLDHAKEAEAAGVDARFLAMYGANVFMKQVMVLGRFHADLHQSNLLMTPDGRICYIDFGITGEVREEDKEAIAQVLAATVYADAKRAIDYSAALGLVVSDEKEDEVTARVAELMRRTFSCTPRDVRGFAVGFLSIMNEQKVSVPRGFGLLIKALVVVEGCAQMVYNDIDIVDAAKEFTTALVLTHMLRPARLYARIPRAVDAAISELIG
ncbi:MAG: AarF/UbiB family protein [Coriobacteriia bacterium]|nr:AarF/UbiB family protein [Coriobacteriia bacterium]